jgi:hypothetical protein
MAQVERLAGLVARGIPFEGAADWVHLRQSYKDKDGALVREAPGTFVVGIGDLKSISRIFTRVTIKATYQGWAQTDAEVCSDPQMLAYGRHRLRLHQGATHARLNKVYAQKKPFLADIRGGLVSRQEVEDRWGQLEERVIDEMIQTAGASKIEDVRPSRGSCDSYTHVVACGYPGCGEGGFPPGKAPSGSPEGTTCLGCKGKGKTQKGCGYRYQCPGADDLIQIPLSYKDRPNQGGSGMSLFDRVAAEPGAPVPPPTSAPSPVMDEATYRAQVEAERRALENGSYGAPPVPPAAPAPTLGDKIAVTLCAPAFKDAIAAMRGMR